jgi:hypothetical protein
MAKNQVASLHGGMLTKTAPVNSDCAVGSIDVDNDNNAFYTDAVVGMQDGHPPFLGAHIANDPNHARATVDLIRCNCQFDPDLMLVLTKDIGHGEEPLVDCNR